MESPETMVKIRYASSAPGSALAKRLFGYDGWKTKVGTKAYPHKAIEAALAGIPFERLSRGTFAVPEQYLSRVQSVIVRSGGIIKSIEVIRSRMESKRATIEAFNLFTAQVNIWLRVASEAKTRDVYVSALNKAIDTTKGFSAFIGPIDEYNAIHTNNQLLKTLVNLMSFADKDLESAKSQVAFFAEDFKETSSNLEV